MHQLVSASEFWWLQVAISVMQADSEDGEALESRARLVRAFMNDRYGFEPMSETRAYLTYLVSRADEARLPQMLKDLEANTQDLGITDLQVTPGRKSTKRLTLGTHQIFNQNLGFSRVSVAQLNQNISRELN
jgi:hypothetical protein